MHKIVVFTPNNARVVFDSDPSKYHGLAVLLDPDLSGVIGVPPHYWKLGDGNVVVPMTPEEREARTAHLDLHGADNRILKAAIEAFDAEEEEPEVEEKPGLSFSQVLTWSMLATIAVFVLLTIIANLKGHG